MPNQKNKSRHEEMIGLTYAEVGIQREFAQPDLNRATELTYADVKLQSMAKQGRKRGLGAGGTCVCPVCGEKISHEQGTPCRSVKCPKCGHFMVRELWGS